MIKFQAQFYDYAYGRISFTATVYASSFEEAMTKIRENIKFPDHIICCYIERDA